jgi:hypothetical protein
MASLTVPRPLAWTASPQRTHLDQLLAQYKRTGDTRKNAATIGYKRKRKEKYKCTATNHRIKTKVQLTQWEREAEEEKQSATTTQEVLRSKMREKENVAFIQNNENFELAEEVKGKSPQVPNGKGGRPFSLSLLSPSNYQSTTTRASSICINRTTTIAPSPSSSFLQLPSPPAHCSPIPATASSAFSPLPRRPSRAHSQMNSSPYIPKTPTIKVTAAAHYYKRQQGNNNNKVTNRTSGGSSSGVSPNASLKPQLQHTKPKRLAKRRNRPT